MLCFFGGAVEWDGRLYSRRLIAVATQDLDFYCATKKQVTSICCWFYLVEFCGDLVQKKAVASTVE